VEQQDRNILERLTRELAKASQNMEKFNIAEYVEALNNPRRYLMINFLGGLSRGLGIAIGFTLLGAFAVYLLQRLVVLNLPVIGDLIAEIVRIVQEHQQQQ
jgi:predicted lipid-binding transport protein (Tim44 family)